MFVDTHRDEQFVVLTLQGEGKFHHKMLSEFHDGLDIAETDFNVGGLIVTGSDKNFSQGFDLERLGKLPGDEFFAFVEQSMTVVARLLAFPVPVIAAVNGHAFGLGAMLALACDYRVMREDRGYFCLPEIDLGMTLINTMNILVTHKLSGTFLRDALLTGRRYGAAELLAENILDGSAAFEALIPTAKTLAAPMMGKQRDTLAGLKTAMHAPIIDAIHTSVPPRR